MMLDFFSGIDKSIEASNCITIFLGLINDITNGSLKLILGFLFKTNTPQDVFTGTPKLPLIKFFSSVSLNPFLSKGFIS